MRIFTSRFKSVSLLVKGYLPFFPLNGNGSIVAEITPGSTPVSLHGLKDIELHSIDGYNSQNNFVCLGADMADYQNATFYTQPLNVGISCTNNGPALGPNPTFMTKQDKYPYKPCSDSFNCKTNKKVTLKQTSNNIVCQ